MQMNKGKIVFFAASLLIVDGTAWAQPGTGKGPVAKQCASEIEKYCAGLKHGHRAVRTCLEHNRDNLSAECKQALDTTGGGRGVRGPYAR